MSKMVISVSLVDYCANIEINWSIDSDSVDDFLQLIYNITHSVINLHTKWPKCGVWSVVLLR